MNVRLERNTHKANKSIQWMWHSHMGLTITARHCHSFNFKVEPKNLQEKHKLLQAEIAKNSRQN